VNVGEFTKREVLDEVTQKHHGQSAFQTFKSPAKLLEKETGI
jgi:hypothetical protein